MLDIPKAVTDWYPRTQIAKWAQTQCSSIIQKYELRPSTVKMAMIALQAFVVIIVVSTHRAIPHARRYLVAKKLLQASLFPILICSHTAIYYALQPIKELDAERQRLSRQKDYDASWTQQRSTWVSDMMDKTPEFDTLLKTGTWESLGKATNALFYSEHINRYLGSHSPPNNEMVDGRVFAYCPANTAVKIDGRYFHANFVDCPCVTRKFIAAQYPVAERLKNNKSVQENNKSVQELFWKSALRHGCIIDLTENHSWRDEDLYYPLCRLNSEAVECGSMHITFQSYQYKEEGNIHEYSYQVTDRTQPTSTKIVKRIHYVDWPDHQVIPLHAFTPLLDQLDTFSLEETLTVHCKAGVGRTGALITGYYLRKLIQDGIITQANFKDRLTGLILSLRIKRGPMFVHQQTQFDLLVSYGQSLLDKKSSTVPLS